MTHPRVPGAAIAALRFSGAATCPKLWHAHLGGEVSEWSKERDWKSRRR